MRNRQKTRRGFASLGLLTLAGGAVWGQDSNQDRALPFSNSTTPQAMLEVLQSVRTVTDVPQALIDDAGRKLAVRGTLSELSQAEWLFRELDGPADDHYAGAHQYRISGDRDPLLRVFHLVHEESPQGMQDLLNAIRITADTYRTSLFYEPRRRSAA